MVEPSDETLRAAFAALSRGEVSALSEVWGLSAPLHSYAYSLAESREDADDILGDVLVRLARQGKRLRRVRSPKAYLFTAVRNAARSLGRRKGPRRSSEPTDAAASEDLAGDAAVRSAVMALSPKQREVVVLHIWGGLTFRELGETLRIPQNTAASRYRYALEKLREILGDEPHGQREAGEETESRPPEHARHHT